MSLMGQHPRLAVTGQMGGFRLGFMVRQLITKRLLFDEWPQSGVSPAVFSQGRRSALSTSRAPHILCDGVIPAKAASAGYSARYTSRR
jgi:hypothetical protein